MVDTDRFAEAFESLPPAVRDFRPKCPGCTPTAVTVEGVRPCSFYDCPGLPAELRVTCDKCMYDFAIHDGQIKCDHSTCEDALRLEGNVETYRTWLQMLRDEVSSEHSAA